MVPSQACGIYRLVSPLLGSQDLSKWYVMTLVCYLDDSGTDPQNKYVTMAGHIGTVDAWQAFERDAKAILDRYKVTVVHARDFFCNDGEFEFWSVDKRLEFVRELNEKLAPRVGLAVSCSTLKSTHKSRAEGRTRNQSPYGFCFENIIHTLLNDKGIRKVVLIPGVDISFVIEQGNKNDDEILNRYKRLKDSHGDTLPFLSGMAFAKKNSSIAIQMADMFAFFTRRHAEKMEENGRSPVEFNHFLVALRKGMRDIGSAATDFYYKE